MARSKHHKFKKRKGLQPKMTVSNSAWKVKSNKMRMMAKMAVTQQIDMEAKQLITNNIQNDINTTIEKRSIKSGMGIVNENG